MSPAVADHICPECGLDMTFCPATLGEPPTLARPMGGCEPTPAYWLCQQCGATAEVEEYDHDEDEW